MSFIYKKTNITLNNYQDIFSACMPDILDEVRSAILDDTQIGMYIDKCVNDAYKLGQIRMAIREMVPVQYISVGMTGKTLYMVRQCISKGYNLDPILKYINKDDITLNPATFEKLLEYVYLGADITKIDFNNVSVKLVDIICKGLLNGFPMWLVVDQEASLSEEKVRTLMRGMQLGLDIHPFIYDDWTNNQLYLLFSYASIVDLNMFLSYVNNRFDTELLRNLLDLYAKKLPIQKLCVKDTDGYPVYNSYQVYELGSAIEDNTITEDMYNPYLSDAEIRDMHISKIKN